ncbi:hypothetical protein [Shimazuella alba]|uniref:Uncharacterized protein n=1 Tax=Shimazuella alba TaxID=2690964 RepID=A0A6I4VPL2_9BACL|nr:hypothetical protein [Shimazuella alba]MXQ52338.1 hypothetical protein [Shimazuella alba]
MFSKGKVGKIHVLTSGLDVLRGLSLQKNGIKKWKAVKMKENDYTNREIVEELGTRRYLMN